VSLVNVRDVILSVVDIRVMEFSELLCPLWMFALCSCLSCYCVRCGYPCYGVI
jgi:hypothetical protein